jgi:hypothetical protein
MKEEAREVSWLVDLGDAGREVEWIFYSSPNGSENGIIRAGIKTNAAMAVLKGTTYEG